MDTDVLHIAQEILEEVRFLPHRERVTLLLELYDLNYISPEEFRATMGIDEVKFQEILAQYRGECLEDRFYPLSADFVTAKVNEMLADMEK